MTLVDPLQEQLPLLERRFKDYQPGTAPATLERLASLYVELTRLSSSRANKQGSSARLTNLLDYFPRNTSSARRDRAYSMVHTLEFVPRSSFERCLRARNAQYSATVPVPKVQTAATDDVSRSAPSNGSGDSRRKWYAEALKTQREKGLPS